MIRGGQPRLLRNWRVTTGNQRVARAVAGAFGGRPKRWETGQQDNIEILTSTCCVDVLFTEPSAISASVRAHGGSLPEMPFRKCATTATGKTTLQIALTFQLARCPDVGLFRFLSSSWSLAAMLHELDSELARGTTPVTAQLLIESVESEQRQEGQSVWFYRPMLKLARPVPDRSLL